ncbi:MAG TPA: DUF2510 domain-containing protein [Acidimicrobiales bacterium]|nr:DUF2510 domain-containing protein [Acidimicrobiales bacterium]
MDRPHPPAWYPDPRQPGYVRRWDGRAWTEDVRVLPGWLRELDLAPGPPSKRVPGDRSVLVRRLWSASTITLVFAVLLLLSLPSTGLSSRAAPGEQVADERFLAAASETCNRANRNALQPFRAGSVDDPDALATALESFVDDLREIDVRPDDRAAVDAWIESWDRLIDAGHSNAAAIEAGDREEAARLNNEALVARAQVNRFSYANGLTTCVL